MGDITVSADTRDLLDLGRRLKQMDRPIQRAIRKTLTSETSKVVKAIRAEVLAIPTKDDHGVAPYRASNARRYQFRSGFVGPVFPTAGPGRNVRQQIAQGVRSAIRYGNTRGQASISVIGSSRFLPGPKKVMNRVLNYQSWRHPVFGNRNVWVEQRGHPFWARTVKQFDQPIHEALAKAVEQAIEAELAGHQPI